MKTIIIPWPDPIEVMGRCAVVPIIVDWFPRLTDNQILQNVLADMNGQPRPHEDPNLIDVVLERTL